MQEELKVTANLIDEKVKFSGSSKSNPGKEIIFDYRSPIGTGQGYTGLEVLLLSFAGCSGTAVAFLLRKMGKTISGLKVNAKGIRKDVPPFSFDTIFLEFILISHDTGDSNIQKAIQLSEESVCPVWAMLKNNVEVKTVYKILTS
ncbi:MAG: OsmC family protein [Methanococcaceae archaeon]